MLAEARAVCVLAGTRQAPRDMVAGRLPVIDTRRGRGGGRGGAEPPRPPGTRRT